MNLHLKYVHIGKEKDDANEDSQRNENGAFYLSYETSTSKKKPYLVSLYA